MPARTVNTKFFLFQQNNVRGKYIDNDDVAINIVVEAMNAEDATRKIEKITELYSDYCPCCGRRWDTRAWDEEGKEDWKEFEKFFEKPFNSVIVYYLDGRKEKLTY